MMFLIQGSSNVTMKNEVKIGNDMDVANGTIGHEDTRCFNSMMVWHGYEGGTMT